MANVSETQLLRKIHRFLKKTGMSPSTFGRECMGSSAFVFDLEQGRQVFGKTRARVENFIKAKEAA